MKILFTASDRDLLKCYKELLEADGHDVETAFDGVQTLTKIKESAPEIVVLDKNLSRIASSDILKTLKEKGIPVILLLSGRLKSESYLSPCPPDSFLCYPFSPDDLRNSIKRVVSLRSKDGFMLGDIKVTPAQRTAADRETLTAEEILLSESISEGKQIKDTRLDTVVGALNEKLTRIGSKSRIKYIIREGYKVVNVSE